MVIVTYLSIVLGELVPKRIGLTLADRAAKLLAPPMHLLSVIAKPFVWLLSQSTIILVKLTGIREGDNRVTEEEIKSMIQEGAEAGEVQEVEQDIMERVLVMGDTAEDEAPYIVERKDDQGWLIDGQCPLYEFLTYFDCEELSADAPNCNTLAGLLLDLLGHIPEVGERIRWHHFRLEVVDMDGARIDKVLATLIPETDD